MRRPVSQYQIICRDQQWQLMIEGQACALLQCDDRSSLIQIACKVAADRRSAVQVFDDRNELEARLSFCDGALAVQGSYQGPLDFGVPEAVDEPGRVAES